MSMICNFRMCADTEIDTLLSNPESIQELLHSESEDEENCEFNLDKAWHGIHFLLCGSAWRGAFPLGFILVGGTPVGEVDLGNGPARVFRPAEVAEIAEALELINRTDLRSRFNAKVFAKNEIYPDIWREPRDQCLDSYVLDYFDALKEFVFSARDAGNGLIVYLN